MSSGVQEIFSNDWSTYAALKDDGSVVTWGDPDYGGDSSSVSNELSSGVKEIHVGSGAFAALKEDGSVVTWGDPDNVGDSSSVNNPSETILIHSWQTSSDGNTWTEVGKESTYQIASADEGNSIKAVISYKDGQGFNETVTTSTSSIPYVDDGDASFSISGTAAVGNTLSINEDSADPDGTGTLSYSWQTSSDGNNWNAVSTDSSYVVTSSEEGKSIKAVISYQDGQGFDETVTTSSANIPYVNDGKASFSINGTAAVGNILSINQDSPDPDGTGTLSYSWQTSSDGNNWNEVSSASTYLVASSEEGKSIKAVISYQDGQGFDETVTTSSANIPYVNDGQASFSINGTAAVGNTLSIKEDSADPDGNGTLSYSWKTKTNGGDWKEVGNESTYTLTSDDFDSDKYI